MTVNHPSSIGFRRRRFWVGAALALIAALPTFADDRRDEAQARFRERVELADQRELDALGSAAVFRRFRPIVEALDLPADKQPTNLFDLSNALGDRPDLMAEFLRLLESPLARSAGRRDTSIDRYSRQLQRRLERIDAVVGPMPPPEPAISRLDKTLSDLDPSSYEVSAHYEIQPPAVIEAASLELDPTEFESMDAQDLTTLSAEFHGYCAGATSCVWPLQYDLLPRQVFLYWRSTLPMKQLKQIVEQDGYVMDLTLNGKTLDLGPQVPYFKDPAQPGQGYWAVAFTDNQGANYIVTMLLARDVLRFDQMPWKFQLNIYSREPLAVPQLIGIDQYGNPTFANDKLVPVSYPAVTFTANPTSSQSYFEAMLYATFQSDRCTDCHGFGTIAKLGEHHGYNHEADFIAATGAKLEPSAYQPSAHVITCTSCHTLAKVDKHGNPFAEKVWKAPYEDLDVNWKLKSASETCGRVVSNLPTTQLRHDHFHKDARLFWAIEKPQILSKILNPPAAPGDFDEFLHRVDIWNGADAPCPY